MSLLANSLTAIGLVLALLGQIIFLLHAFRTSLLWGVGVLLIPPVSLAFLLLHWNRAKDAFFLQVWALGFIVLAGLGFGADLGWPGP